MFALWDTPWPPFWATLAGFEGHLGPPRVTYASHRTSWVNFGPSLIDLDSIVAQKGIMLSPFRQCVGASSRAGTRARAGTQKCHSNNHNSAVPRAPELILGAPYTNRPSRSSWDRSRSIPGCPGPLFDEHIYLFFQIAFSLTGASPEIRIIRVFD